VLVAKRYIPPNAMARPGRFERRMVPEAFVNPGAVSDASTIEGLVAVVPLSAGEQVLANKFAKPGHVLSGGVEPGKRAYCLDVTESSGVGGLLKPGDHVDVLARYDSASRRTASFALQDLPVLAVGSATGTGRFPGEESGGRGYGHVTLSVTPAEAECLAFLEDRAALKLVLRSDGDDEVITLPPLEEGEVLSRLGRPLRTARTVEVIRGPGIR
jgi:pilus assembly protein CpaB